MSEKLYLERKRLYDIFLFVINKGHVSSSITELFQIIFFKMAIAWTIHSTYFVLFTANGWLVIFVLYVPLNS